MDTQRAVAVAAARNFAGVDGMPAGPAGKKESSSQEMTVRSRFGEVAVNPEQALLFPQGLLGIPQPLRFCLTDVPDQRNGQFRLLQCLDDHSLSFVVLPLGLDNPYIARADLDDCCKVANIKPENLLVLALVTVQRSPDATLVTGNIRAPVIVDVSDRAAIQYVFPHSKYEIGHVLFSR